MNNKEVITAIKAARGNSKKRNFKQSFDLIINLKNINIKKTDEQLDFFVPLHFNRGKKIKICALVGPELESDAKNVCDNVIPASDFQKYTKDKKLVKKLSEDYYYFIAQANIMPQVATTFGRVLGPRGKMPNPKAGCVVPPKGSLKPLYDKLQKTIKIVAKTDPIVHCVVGDEDMPDEEIMDNVLTIYNQVIHHLPQEKNNIKSIYLKLTMGKSTPLMGTKPVKEKKPEPVKEKKESKEEKKEEIKEEKEPKEDIKKKSKDKKK